MAQTSDILVIGGGIAGLSAAAALSEQARVTVAEAEEQCGFHSSGRSAAMLHYALGNPVVRKLTLASRGFFDEVPDSGSPLATLLPILTPAREDELPALRALADDLAPFTKLEWLDADGLRRECPVLRIGPQDAQHGLIDREALKLDGHRMLQVHLHRLRERGAQVHCESRIADIHRDGGVWRIRTERGDTYEAPTVVNSAGAWADAVAGRAGVTPIGLQPMRRTIIVFDAPEGVDVHRLPFTKTATDEVYFGPEAGRIFASPMDEVPTDPCDAQPGELEMALAAHRIEERTVMPVKRIVHRWAGLRTFAPDRIPVVGFAPDADGFFWLAGQGGAGLQTSPAMASAAASLILSAPWPVPGVTPEELSPGRFLG